MLLIPVIDEAFIGRDEQAGLRLSQQPQILIICSLLVSAPNIKHIMSK